MSLTAAAFALLFGSMLVLAIARHPIYGLYAYMLAFYGFPPGRWWGADLPDIRWSLIAALVTLISLLFYRKESTRPPPLYTNSVVILFSAFVVWLCIQQLWALDGLTHWYFAITYAKYAVVIYMFYRILLDREQILGFAVAHVFGCAYYAWLAYNVTRGGRIEAIGGPNMDGASAFSAHLTTGLIFAAILLFLTRGPLRTAIFLTIPFILNGIILTQSRAAFLGLLAGGIVVVYLSPATYRKWIYPAAGLAVALFFLLAHDAFWERMSSIVDAVERTEDMDGSAASRWELIASQWEMFSEAPLLGSGHRGTVVMSYRYLDEQWMSRGGGRSSHNTVMSLLVEQGLIGTVIYVGLCFAVVLMIRRMHLPNRGEHTNTYSLYRAALAGSLANLLVAGQFGDFLRLEVVVWCFVLTVIVSNLSHRAAAKTVENGNAIGESNTAVGAGVSAQIDRNLATRRANSWKR